MGFQMTYLGSALLLFSFLITTASLATLFLIADLFLFVLRSFTFASILLTFLIAAHNRSLFFLFFILFFFLLCFPGQFLLARSSHLGSLLVA